MFRFHVNLPGCKYTIHASYGSWLLEVVSSLFSDSFFPLYHTFLEVRCFKVRFFRSKISIHPWKLNELDIPTKSHGSCRRYICIKLQVWRLFGLSICEWPVSVVDKKSRFNVGIFEFECFWSSLSQQKQTWKTAVAVTFHQLLPLKTATVA